MQLRSAVDDLQALLTGSLLAALGIVLLKSGGLLAGGTVGLSLVASYAAGVPLPLTFVLVNAPFYAFASMRMGREFTVKTLLAVALTAAFTHLLPQGVELAHVSTAWAAVLGGLLAGIGLLILFRHTASLGGLNVVAVFVQRRWGINAGCVQLLLDALILLAGSAALGNLDKLPPSVVAVAVLNGVLMLNHRPARPVSAG